MCNTLAYCQSIGQNQPQESCATHWLTVRVSAKTSPKSHVQHIGLLSEYRPKPAPRVMCNTLAYCVTHWLTVRVSAKTSPKSHVQHIGLLCEYQPKPAPRVMCNTLAYCVSISQNQPQESCVTHWLTVRVSAKTSPKSHVQHIGLLCEYQPKPAPRVMCNTLAYCQSIGQNQPQESCATHWLTVRV